MSFTNNYAVCIKMCEIIDQTKSTNRSRLLIGDLVQIRGTHYSEDCARYIIQRFDREMQTFQSVLYQCVKDNLSEIPTDMWPTVRNISAGSVLNVRLTLISGQQVVVIFQVKFFGEISSLGRDLFYGLQIMPTPNLTKEHIMQINQMYFSPSFCLIILRADKLILNIVDNPDYDDLKLRDADTSQRDNAANNFQLVSSRDFESNDDVYKPKQTANIIKLFLLPKVNENETNQATAHGKSRKIFRRQKSEDHRKCKSCCSSCANNEETLIQLNCQHIFCFECLIKSLNDGDFQHRYCPYKNKNYTCRYNITVDDMRYILDIANGNSMEKCNLSKSKVHFHKCTACHFICKTGGRVIYQCINCKGWNCIDIQNDTGNVETQSRPTPKPTVPPLRNQTLPQTSTWACAYCTYENRNDTHICAICLQKNETSVRKSNTTEYYRLAELEENDTFIPNAHKFYCAFCDQTIAPDDGVILRSCLHNVCRKCIVSYIECQDQVEIKCPHTMCSHLLQDREIKTLISPQAYARHLNMSLNIAKAKLENGYQCCMPNCDGFWLYDIPNVRYNCPKCAVENCITCRASHPGIECRVFQAQSK